MKEIYKPEEIFKQNYVINPNYLTLQIIDMLQKDNPGQSTDYLESPIFVSYPLKKPLEEITVREFFAIAPKMAITNKAYNLAYNKPNDRLSSLRPDYALAAALFDSYTRMAGDVAGVLSEALKQHYTIKVILSDEPFRLLTYHECLGIHCYGNGRKMSDFSPLFANPEFITGKHAELDRLASQIKKINPKKRKKSAISEPIIRELMALEEELNMAAFSICLWSFFKEMEEAYTALLEVLKKEGRLSEDISIRIN